MAKAKIDPRISGVMTAFTSAWHECNIDGLDAFKFDVKKYSKRGADFSGVWRRFVIHMLEGSKYSALASVRKSKYPKKKEIVNIILRAVDIYKHGGGEFDRASARRAAKLAALAAEAAADTAQNYGDTRSEVAAMVAVEAARSAWAACRALSSNSAVSAEEATWRSWQAAMWASGSRGGAAERAVVAASEDYAKKLLELMAKAAGSTKRNPSKRLRNAMRDSQRVIDECHALWELYLAQPDEGSLVKVIRHLKKMGLSSSWVVLNERDRCLRVANEESRRLGLR